MRITSKVHLQMVHVTLRNTTITKSLQIPPLNTLKISPSFQTYDAKCNILVKSKRKNVSIMSHRRSTVNSELFARVLFTRNFVNTKFRENGTLAKW